MGHLLCKIWFQNLESKQGLYAFASLYDTDIEEM
jgi:hypothetical protein